MNRAFKLITGGIMALTLTAALAVASTVPANAEPNCKQDTTYIKYSTPLPVGNLVCGYSGNDTGRMLYADRVAAFNYASNGDLVAARKLMIKDIVAVTLTMATTTHNRDQLMGIANHLVNDAATTRDRVNKVYTLLMYHAQYYGANVGSMNDAYKIAKIITGDKYVQKLGKAAGVYSVPFLKVYMTAVFESQAVANYIGNTAMFTAYYNRQQQI